MAKPNSKAPIIIIKRNAGHGGHHGGAWKVAYADFVTAMMALFIVLWMMNSTAQVQKAVGGYFKDPMGTGKKTGSDMSGSGDSLVISKDNMAELKDELQQTMRQNVNLEKLNERIEMTVTGEGLRIELMESEAGTFFESAAPKPTDDGRKVLSMLAEELKKIPNTLSIEGHTDARPYSKGTGYTNWELSADRANTARRIMEEFGVRPGQISQIRGYASQRLRTPDKPDDAANRRISLIVQYRDKQK